VIATRNGARRGCDVALRAKDRHGPTSQKQFAISDNRDQMRNKTNDRPLARETDDRRQQERNEQTDEDEQQHEAASMRCKRTNKKEQRERYNEQNQMSTTTDAN